MTDLLYTLVKEFNVAVIKSYVPEITERPITTVLICVATVLPLLLYRRWGSVSRAAHWLYDNIFNTCSSLKLIFFFFVVGVLIPVPIIAMYQSGTVKDVTSESPTPNYKPLPNDSNNCVAGTPVSTLLTKDGQACYLTQHSEDIAAIRTRRPEDYELQLIRWKDPSTGAKREFRLKEEIVGSCRKIGTTFGIKDVALDVMCTDPEKCCDKVLLSWSQGKISRREKFPFEWGGLIDAVHENCPQVADDLENALTNQL